MSITFISASTDYSNKEGVVNDTWGHLKHKLYKKYKGFVVFSISDWGDIEILTFNFGIDGNPWLEYNIRDFMHLINDIEEPGIYKFVGTFKPTKTKSNYNGEIKHVKFEDL